MQIYQILKWKTEPVSDSHQAVGRPGRETLVGTPRAPSSSAVRHQRCQAAWLQQQFTDGGHRTVTGIPVPECQLSQSQLVKI